MSSIPRRPVPPPSSPSFIGYEQTHYHALQLSPLAAVEVATPAGEVLLENFSPGGSFGLSPGGRGSDEEQEEGQRRRQGGRQMDSEGGSDNSWSPSVPNNLSISVPPPLPLSTTHKPLLPHLADPSSSSSTSSPSSPLFMENTAVVTAKNNDDSSGSASFSLVKSRVQFFTALAPPPSILHAVEAQQSPMLPIFPSPAAAPPSSFISPPTLIINIISPPPPPLFHKRLLLARRPRPSARPANSYPER
eukprot:GHVS01007620.1.p2 GENE.GHVS01007620.1~~GHVS01007620.1.p2  ORF type:complete len:247 (+),score=98.71 GHVS01007620.1:187-927(+)